jgi:hypothetical protein
MPTKVGIHGFAARAKASRGWPAFAGTCFAATTMGGGRSRISINARIGKGLPDCPPNGLSRYACTPAASGCVTACGSHTVTVVPTPSSLSIDNCPR